MAHLSHQQCDILQLAAQATVGPQLPAPPEIAASIDDLLDRALLHICDGRVEITEAGLAVLQSHPEMEPICYPADG